MSNRIVGGHLKTKLTASLFLKNIFVGHLKPAYKKVCGMCLFQHFETYARGSLKGEGP